MRRVQIHTKIYQKDGFDTILTSMCIRARLSILLEMRTMAVWKGGKGQCSQWYSRVYKVCVEEEEKVRRRRRRRGGTTLLP